MSVPDARVTARTTGRGNLDEALLDFEVTFHIYYERVARTIGRVVRNPARAEELAVEVFWKYWRKPPPSNDNPGGWLYRVAVRLALDELRRQTRRQRFESLLGQKILGHKRAKLGSGKTSPEQSNPEEILGEAQRQEQVRMVLARLPPAQAELLLLRSSDLSYGEVASTLGLNPSSVGTMMARAQQAFRKEYVKRYGEQ